MAARRLLIVMLVLLGLSSLAAALVPAPEDPAETDSSTTSTSTSTAVPGGELVRAVIAADTRRAERVQVPVGDQLALEVRSRRPGEIEIPRLGLLQDVASGSPARFDILAREPGKLEVRRVGSRRPVGVIEVADRGGGGG